MITVNIDQLKSLDNGMFKSINVQGHSKSEVTCGQVSALVQTLELMCMGLFEMDKYKATVESHGIRVESYMLDGQSYIEVRGNPDKIEESEDNVLPTLLFELAAAFDFVELGVALIASGNDVDVDLRNYNA